MKPTICSSHACVRNALALLISTWILGVQIAAGQGTAFTYQGHLADGGSSANGLYDLRFAIYDAASGGNAVGGPLTNAMTTVTSGVFTVTLDFGAGVFTGADRWLEIGVRTNAAGTFTNLSPRQPITATPYAIRAANFSGVVAASQLTGAISSNNIGAGSINSTMLAAGAVTTAALADGAVTADKMFTIANRLALTFTNPTPAVDDNFGFSVATVGNDRVLIGTPHDNTGDPNAGAAYLFNTSGVLLTTLTNPTPFSGEAFGRSVTSVGSDKVLIGTPVHFDINTGVFPGAAYLFSTNGALLTTFTNPTPAHADFFGNSVAAVGNDRVLIGAQSDDTGTTNTGAAYLFSANGTLLTTFTNPTPAVGDEFGSPLAALGSDRVLIGAHRGDAGATNAGAAYLFSTNGTLLTTFTNPTPAFLDDFGSAVAAMGNDRVLIGAQSDSTGANGAGSAYLFSTNGTLLTTFTNPTPAFVDHFGVSVAVVGTDRLLIGAHGDDTGANGAGAVYLFSTNGVLLTTFTNPTPEIGDTFGEFVAVMGSDRVLIGADQDDTGATNAGAAYLFTLESYSPGVVADGVRSGSITATSLDPAIGVWTRSGNDVFRSSGNVGIGTTPGTPLHIATPVYPVMVLQDTGPDSTQQSGYISFWNATPSETAWVGYGTEGSPHFSVVNVRPSGNIVLYTIFGPTLTATSSGLVGIRRTPTANALEVEGNASKTVAGSWVANSDARIKTNVRTVTHALEKLEQVRPVEFRYTEAYRAQHPSIEDRDYLNVIAQEFQQVFPDAVKRSGDKLPNGDDILQVDTYPLTIYSAAAIQELNRKLTEELKRRDAENAELKARLERIERRLNKQNGGAR